MTQRPERLPVSAFIICLNEEAVIENCLRSLDICGEIVVVDSGSNDRTAQIVERFIADGWPVRFVRQPWLGYARQKQMAMDECTLPWRLNIDADERLDDALRDALPNLVAASREVVGWRLHRRPYLIGRGYTPKTVKERANLRLVRAGAGAYDLSQRVHEGIRVTGEVRTSPVGSLLHYRALPIDEQILKENTYSSLKAGQLFDEGRAPRRIRLLFNPPLYFLRLYLLHRFYRCGWPGFIQAMTAAVYSFLTEAKLYQRHALAHLAARDEIKPDF